ncbi:hypothetical protein [uncultured Sphaerochaeta sp.]|nr:hypothetical protein [uncultured Sphaerochaeta sp.]
MPTAFRMGGFLFPVSFNTVKDWMNTYHRTTLKILTPLDMLVKEMYLFFL